MIVQKETVQGNANPLFLRFINRETGVLDILLSFARSSHETTQEAAKKALQTPPNLDDFRVELEEAVREIISVGLGAEFKDFVNHYMEPSLEEVVNFKRGKFGDNRSQIATVKDDTAPWVQGMICYNLCLYIKAFGLESLKSCKTCNKLFAHKGQYAVYCNDKCNPKKKRK